jgi:hypothetical protein
MTPARMFSPRSCPPIRFLALDVAGATLFLPYSHSVKDYVEHRPLDHPTLRA